MGLVINHLSDQSLRHIFEQLEIDCDNEEILNTPVFIGGPVKLRQGFVLHTLTHDWDKSLRIADSSVMVTSSRDILEHIARGQGPEKFLVMLGFAGWSAGQLEQELQRNAWLTARSSTDITFHPDIDAKWQMAFDTLGFNLDKLSPFTGHA